MCTIAHYSKTTAYTGEVSPTQEASDNSFVPAKGKEKGASVAIKANALAKGLHDRKEEVVKKGTSPFVSPSVRHHRMLVVQVANCLCRRQPADTVEAQKQPRQGYLWRGDSGHESRYEEADGGQRGQLRKRARHQQEGQSNTHSVSTPELRPNQRSVLCGWIRWTLLQTKSSHCARCGTLTSWITLAPRRRTTRCAFSSSMHLTRFCFRVRRV